MTRGKKQSKATTKSMNWNVSNTLVARPVVSNNPTADGRQWQRNALSAMTDEKIRSYFCNKEHWCSQQRGASNDLWMAATTKCKKLDDWWENGKILWHCRAPVVAAERGIQWLMNGSNNGVQRARWLMRKWEAFLWTKSTGRWSGGEQSRSGRWMSWAVDLLKFDGYNSGSRWSGDREGRQSNSKSR